jgi:HPt (histidine-containing phosphotransfer) domain-containing protein
VNNINQLDLDLLNGYFDSLGEQVVKKMLALYVQQSALYLKDILQAITHESQELWQEHCHKMKGAAGSVGLLKVHAKLVLIEKLKAPSEKKSTELSELIKLNQLAIEVFNSWLTEKGQ